MLAFEQFFAVIIQKYLGVAQMEARYLGVVEAAGSNPVTQTKNLGCSCNRDFSFPSHFRLSRKAIK